MHGALVEKSNVAEIAHTQSRTTDLSFTKAALYQLSYTGGTIEVEFSVYIFRSYLRIVLVLFTGTTVVVNNIPFLQTIHRCSL
jgi:hypothetical protein